MKTTIHYYNINVETEEGKEEWKLLKEKLKSTPGRGHRMKAFGDDPKDRLGKENREIELETDCFFNDQWNTECGLRVFDWWQEYLPHTNKIRRGHYLDITEEMMELRRNTSRCGYCGKLEPSAKGYAFCPHCIDSQYLERDDLPLTRMMPVEFDGIREPLTEAEREHLFPVYRDAQINGRTDRGKKRIAALRERLQSDKVSKIEKANEKYDGFIWLLDEGVKTDNVIYYGHTRKFGFGWRRPFTRDDLVDWQDILSRFPFDYTVKEND